jgi:hypothetical protein
LEGEAVNMALFFDLIENHELIKNIVENKGFENVDFKNRFYIKHFDNSFSFENIIFGNDIIGTLSIIIAPETIEITMITSNINYFDNPIDYFGIEGVQHEKEPYQKGGMQVREFRRKVGSFTIFNKTFRISVLKSDAYGCIIKLGCYTY